MDYMQQLGVAIREARRQRRLSISEVHYRTRLSHQAITKLERGKVYPRIDTLLSICQALEVKPSSLFVTVDSRL